jgi:hypothetical protein
MIATGPPRKEKGVPENTPVPNPLTSPKDNSGVASAQLVCASTIIWRHWEVEAGRLFREFWETSDPRHLRAFAAHVYGMRRMAGRRRS